ncbi:Transmembrane emp24 domain-containing protein 5 [Blattella germanica]|nr:Transmembrane emp24 domain-containing protein 5 [Blattella germanica]
MAYREVILYIFLISLLKSVNCLEKEMTVSIDPRREECFYETVTIGQVIDIEYQVIDGGQGEIDINFHLAAPSGRIIVADIKKPENSHRTLLLEEKSWNIGLEVNVNITIYMKMGDVEGAKGMTKDVIGRVRAHLAKVRHIQDTLRAFEARDRNIAESNFVRVNYWSMIQIVGMIFVGLIQVIMLRSLFDDKSRVHRLWKSTFASR